MDIIQESSESEVLEARRDLLKDYGREQISFFVSPPLEEDKTVNWFKKIKSSQSTLNIPRFERESGEYYLERGEDVPDGEQVVLKRLSPSRYSLRWYPVTRGIVLDEVLRTIIDSISEEPFQVDAFDYGISWLDKRKGNHAEDISETFFQENVREFSSLLSEHLEGDIAILSNDVNAYWSIGEQYQLSFRASGSVSPSELRSQDFTERPFFLWSGVLREDASSVEEDELYRAVREHCDFAGDIIWNVVVNELIVPFNQLLSFEEE